MGVRWELEFCEILKKMTLLRGSFLLVGFRPSSRIYEILKFGFTKSTSSSKRRLNPKITASPESRSVSFAVIFSGMILHVV